jgi:hypothetical protein
MKLKKFQPLLEVFITSFLIFVCHKTLFNFIDNNSKYENFYFTIETIYGFFVICSLFIVTVLLLVQQKSKDNVGYAFMLITCIKAAISIALLNLILKSKNPNIEYEKINFFVIFAVFLALETIITIRILNNNQYST